MIPLMDRSVRVVKRGMDVVLSLLGLAVTVPVYPLIAAAIKLDSRGPVLYRQRRAREYERNDGDPSRVSVFDMLKFRTMRQDAEAASGAVLAQKGDPRVTRVGRVLRKTRLDELPQFWNVLRGEMSMVGPRPERPELLSNLAAAVPFFEERLRLVKPGVTGLAQVNLDYTGRMYQGSPLWPHRAQLLNPFELEGALDCEADDMRTKMLYDFAYAAALERFTSFLRTDLEILARTPLVMVFGRGR
jgi:lipopolysaccharide/colanic/teichoic acid biosynthesis glycosyltransferase